MRMPKAEVRLCALRSACSIITGAIVAATMFATPASAETSITVAADKARIISITGEPAAVIIGNPTFADVTVRNGQVIIHGRHYGSTNLLILDDNGDLLANFELNVVQNSSSSMVVYKAGQRQSYTCAPNCEATLSVGDNPDYFDKVVQTQIVGKTTTAAAAAKLAE